MSLRAIVRVLGGELYHNGARANVPAPGHGPADRSVSLLLSAGRVVIHSFGGATWCEVRDDLRRRGLVDRDGRLAESGGVSAPPADRSTRLAAARRLWSDGLSLAPGSVVLRHLALRRVAYETPFADLAEHPNAPFCVYGPGGRGGRAMMAAIRAPEGDLAGVELTYLTPGGQANRRLRIPRKTVGQAPAGSAVRLFPAGSRMLVAEGVVTTLSAAARFRLPAWALLSAGNLARWRPPSGVTQVLIAGDRGATGEVSARELQRRLEATGVEARIALPPMPWGDWNEAAPTLGGRRKG